MIEGDDDRISHLPDEILCHILSFVPTINSVTTCVLSKRWVHLWKYVTKLSFDDSCLHPSKYARFANIVNSVLSVHTPKVKVLEKLSLKCQQIHKLYDVTKWLSASSIRNIQSLDLKIYYGEARFKLPSCMFTCKTLESLMLEGNILLNVPSHVCLPKLRTLELIRVVYQEHNDGSLVSTSSSLESSVIETVKGYAGYLIMGFNPKMLSSTLRHIKLVNNFCRTNNVMVPSTVFTFETLEKLSLRGSFFICGLPATICMPNLTFLEIVDVEYEDNQFLSRLIPSCTSLESLNVANKLSMEAELNISSRTLKLIELGLFCRSNPGHRLVINAPALKKLKLNSRGRVDYHSANDLASLEEAVVRIDFDKDISPDDCSSTLINVWQALRHLKSLKLMLHNYKVGVFRHALPMFNRLTELNVAISSYDSGVLLGLIMNSTTNLKNLTLRGSCGYNWRDPKSVPVCLLTSVMSVSITSFRGGVDEMLMAKYILRNTRILEKMEICFDLCCSKTCEKKRGEDIFNFWRSSEKCIVLIK